MPPHPDFNPLHLSDIQIDFIQRDAYRFSMLASYRLDKGIIRLAVQLMEFDIKLGGTARIINIKLQHIEPGPVGAAEAFARLEQAEIRKIHIGREYRLHRMIPFRDIFVRQAQIYGG